MKELIQLLRKIGREDPDLFPTALFLARFGKPNAFLGPFTDEKTISDMSKYALHAYETERKWLGRECDQIIALLISSGALSFASGSDRRKYVLKATGMASSHMFRNGTEVRTVESDRFPWQKNPQLLEAASTETRERIKSFAVRSRRFIQCQKGWADSLMNGLSFE